jgi:hypothetical protein
MSMRRLLRGSLPARPARVLGAAVACAVLALSVAVAPPAQAAPLLRGQLVDFTGGDNVSGVSVVLRVDGASCGLARDLVVDRATSGSRGRFVLDAAGRACDQMYLVVRRTAAWQGGFLTSSGYLSTRSSRRIFGPADTIGDVQVFPALVRGRVLDPTTKEPVAAARVVVTAPTGLLRDRIAATMTRENGLFVVHGIAVEEIGIFVRGPAGYEHGWLACDRTIVPTWGAACSHTPGRVGAILLDPAT